MNAKKRVSQYVFCAKKVPPEILSCLSKTNCFLRVANFWAKHLEPGDSKWPFLPLVGGHLTICKGHLTIPKRSPAELPINLHPQKINHGHPQHPSFPLVQPSVSRECIRYKQIGFVQCWLPRHPTRMPRLTWAVRFSRGYVATNHLSSSTSKNQRCVYDIQLTLKLWDLNFTFRGWFHVSWEQKKLGYLHLFAIYI